LKYHQKKSIQKGSFTMRIFAILLLLFSLAGCSKGLDRKLITGQDEEKYQASLTLAAKEAQPDEVEAFNWAVSDFNVAKLHATYPDATMRQIIQGEVKAGLAVWPQRLAELQKLKSHFDEIRAELGKIKTESVAFELKRDFFGIKPTIEAIVVNGSKLGVSKLTWRAQLFIDGQKEPVASAELYDLYNNAHVGTSLFDEDAQSKKVAPGGLAPGATVSRSFQVGHVTGNANWSTLAIQNASQRTVVMTPILDSVTDYNDKEMTKGDPGEAIEQLQANIEAARKYQKY
jgi:hypothetical protein